MVEQNIGVREDMNAQWRPYKGGRNLLAYILLDCDD